MPSSTKRVLIYRLGSLGDTLVALPALHLVARAFPDAERRMLTNFPVNVKAPAAAAILENTGLVHGYFRYAVGTRNPRDLLSPLVADRPLASPGTRLPWRVPVAFASARRDASFFRLCGIRRLIGVPLTEDMQSNRWQESEQALEPEGERLVRNLAELGDARIDDPESWDLHLTAAEKARAIDVLRPAAGHPMLAVSVGTKVQSKDWGRENWRDLLTATGRTLSRLTRSPSPARRRRARPASLPPKAGAKLGGGPVINLCGLLTPRESAAVFAHARLFIGHDSGPMHLAAAVQTPCVAIFAARNKPRVWFPYGRQHRVVYHQTDCWGCGLETCIVERKKCITSITVEEVLTEVRAALAYAAVASL